MPQITNITEGVLSYRMNRLLPGEPAEVSDEDAAYLMETYPERFQLAGRDRMARGRRNRAVEGAEPSVSDSAPEAETES